MHFENVLSVFDGHSGLMISLEAAGHTVGTYHSSEIDNHAIKASKACFPNIKRLGDIRNIDASMLPKIDLIGGGSPCQSFSFAGKRKGMAAIEIEKFIAPTIEDWKKHQEDEETIYMDFDEYVVWSEERFDIEQSRKNRVIVEVLDLEHYMQLKSENFEFDGQSYLFWEYIRLYCELKKVNPDIKFFLENVEMGEKWERILTKAIGVNGIHINSALVSAQNRRRIYWTNIGMQPGGLFGEMESIIQQPKDRGIFLKDILETDVDEKYYIKNPKFGFNGLDLTRKGKTLRISTGYSQTDKHNYNPIKFNVKGNIKKDQNKASCFTAAGNSGGNHSDMDLICVAMRGRGENNEQQLEPRHDNKTNSLTSVQKDNLIICHNTMPRSSKTGKGGTGPLSRYDGKTYCLDTGKTNAIEIINREVVQLNPSKESGGQQPYQQNRVYSPNGIAPALCANKSDLNIEVIGVIGCDYRTDEGIRYREGGKTGTLAARARNDESCGQLASINSRIRRLTPRECGRLQTIPEHLLDIILSSGVSDSQIYKMFGNGWNIQTIVHILKYMI